MSDRNRSEKTFAQDAAGFAFILLGGFAAVSIVLYLRGQEPSASVRAFTWPVVELVALIGSSAALAFCGGLAVLGATLFLRSTVLAPTRPLAACTATALGLALIFGAFGAGGELGAWLPSLLAGFAGRALGAVLGLALAWLGWTLFFATRPAPGNAARDFGAAVQRFGLGERHEAAAGVSPAEAALLDGGPRPVASARREEPRSSRPDVARAPAAANAHGVVAPLPRASRPAATAPVRPVASPSAAPVAAPSVAAKAAPVELTPPVAPISPPVPSWEGVDENENDDVEDGGPAGELAALAQDVAPAPEVGGAETRDELAAELEAEFELEDDAALAEELEEEEDDEAEEHAAADELPSAAPALAAAEPAPRAAWEQIGLFDETEEELEEEAVPEPKAELTPSFDFESSEPKRPVHEPEVEDPFAREPAMTPAPLETRVSEPDEDPEPAAAAPAREIVPARPPAAKPAAAVRAPEPRVVREEREEREEAVPLARGDEGEAFERLVFESGLAILEEKRVAVSMLERRFKIDFDQACRVLDELQEAGLIGPYMGGRTRDILLTREEWLAHAPHAS